MEKENIRCYVTADGNAPDKQGDNSSDNARKMQVKELVKYSKDVRNLFIVGIVSLIATIFANDTLSSFLGIISSIAGIATTVCSVMLILIYFRLGNIVEDYKVAASCNLIAVAIRIVGAIITLISTVALFANIAFISNETLDLVVIIISIIILIAGDVVGIYGTYKEYMAHAELVLGINNDLSKKWKRLWGWTLFALCAGIVGALMAIMLPSLGTIVILAASIVSIVVTIIKMIYLKKMSNLFVKLEQESQGWDKAEAENI